MDLKALFLERDQGPPQTAKGVHGPKMVKSSCLEIGRLSKYLKF